MSHKTPTLVTERQKRAALERYEEGIDLVSEIAADYGVHEDSVIRWARQAGVKRFHWSGIGHTRRKFK